MSESSITNFGLLIAYLAPGFTALWGASLASPTLRTWMAASPSDAPTVAGFLYVTMASIVAGLTCSTIRWAIIDTIHHRTGIARPELDFARLGKRVAAFDLLIDVHYRYYQFYGNMLVALIFGYGVRRFATPVADTAIGWPDAAFVILAAIFFAGSRDTLRKYYRRASQLLGGSAAARE